MKTANDYQIVPGSFPWKLPAVLPRWGVFYVQIVLWEFPTPWLSISVAFNHKQQLHFQIFNEITANSHRKLFQHDSLPIFIHSPCCFLAASCLLYANTRNTNQLCNNDCLKMRNRSCRFWSLKQCHAGIHASWAPWAPGKVDEEWIKMDPKSSQKKTGNNFPLFWIANFFCKWFGSIWIYYCVWLTSIVVPYSDWKKSGDHFPGASTGGDISTNHHGNLGSHRLSTDFLASKKPPKNILRSYLSPCHSIKHWKSREVGWGGLEHLTSLMRPGWRHGRNVRQSRVS